MKFSKQEGVTMKTTLSFARPACLAAVALLFGAGLASAQTPPSSGRTLWLRADLGVSTNSSGQVLTWTDQSGTGRDVTSQLIGDPGYWPSYFSSVVNGLPVVRFDGGVDGKTDILIRANPDVTTAVSATQVDVFMVKKQPSSGVGPDQTLFMEPDEDGSNRMRLTFALGDLYFDYGNNSLGGGGRISGSPPSGWYDAFHLTEAVRFSSGLGQINVDYRNAVTDTFTDALDPTTKTQLRIAPAGDLAELLIYDRALTGAEREDVLKYLSDKYNIAPEPGSVVLMFLAFLSMLSLRRR